jgi:hypothetical protein
MQSSSRWVKASSIDYPLLSLPTGPVKWMIAIFVAKWVTYVGSISLWLSADAQASWIEWFTFRPHR